MERDLREILYAMEEKQLHTLSTLKTTMEATMRQMLVDILAELALLSHTLDALEARIEALEDLDA